MGQKKPLPDHMKKANILEDVVALLHDEPDVVIQKKVFLPTVSTPKRTREIDVLATGLMLGRQMRLAFECKNYTNKIGITKIDEFGGKLQDVGIPLQHGIFVVTGELTIDARQRAKELGIRLLRLEGLTKERMSAEIHEAFRSVIFLMAEVSEVNLTSTAADASTAELFQFADGSGQIVGRIPDLIWAAWRDEKIPRTLGSHTIALNLPPGWRWLLAGNHTVGEASAVVKVRAIVATQTGKAQRLSLRDAETNEFDRGRITAWFDEGESGRIRVPAEHFFTEEDLQKRMRETRGIARVRVGRIPLPRIVFNANHFWPPSLKAGLRIRQLAANLLHDGKGLTELQNLSLSDIEGDDLSAIWDDITPEHPAASDPSWPWPKTRGRGRDAAPRMRATRRVGPRQKSERRR